MSDGRSGSDSRTTALRRCLVAYGIAAVVAAACALAVGSERPVLAALVADVGATIAVFVASRLYDNSSLYDPYWSVAPLPIALYWMGTRATPEADAWRQLAALAVVAWWGGRLTYNWARGWGGLQHEDWRYRDMREKTGRAYWAVSFLGIHMVPTLFVFAGCLPLLAVFSGRNAPFGLVDLIAIAVSAGAITIESRADKQLLRFRRGNRNPEAILKSGLWARSRHPNYFGEISFWWGIYLFALAADPTYWWTGLGAVAITALFRFVSLPLIENRMLERRPGFADHMRTTPIVIPRLGSGVQRAGESPSA